MTDSYFECKRCSYKCNQKVNMIRHFNRKNLCIKKNEVINYDNNELYKKSLERIYTNNIIQKSDKINVCDNCNNFFHTKYALNNHIKIHCKHIDITKFKKPIHIKNTFSGINMRHHIGDTVVDVIEDTPIEDTVVDTPIEDTVVDTVVDTSIEDKNIGKINIINSFNKDLFILNKLKSNNDTYNDTYNDKMFNLFDELLLLNSFKNIENENIITQINNIEDETIYIKNKITSIQINNIENEIIDIEDEMIDIEDEIIDIKDEIIDIKDEIIDIEDEIIDIKDEIIDIEENEIIYIECDNRNKDNNTDTLINKNISIIKNMIAIKDYWYKTYSYYRYKFYFNYYYYCYSYKYYYKYKNLKESLNHKLTIKDNIHKMIDRLHKYIIDYIIPDS